jgi:F-type H+-transporting ATPase subunit b
VITQKRTLRRAVLGLFAGAALSLSAFALAQQPPGPAPQPPVSPPGAPRTTVGQPGPGAQPGQPGRPMPPGMPPGAGRPGKPPGHPAMGGPQGGRPFPPGGRPGMPAPRPAPTPAHEEHEEHAHAEHCPGHGPMDPPSHPNWWHGMIGVNNEKAVSESFVDKLLWRYENHADPCDPKNEPPPFAASILNFLVLVGLLVKFGKKPLAEALVARKATIMRDIDTATELREEAEARLDEYQQKLDNLEQTLEEFRADFASRTEHEQKRLLAEAEERRVRMKKDAELRVEQELKEARAQLLKEAVEGAVRAAEQLLASKVAAPDQERLANDYLAGLGTSMQAGSADASSARAGGAA